MNTCDYISNIIFIVQYYITIYTLLNKYQRKGFTENNLLSLYTYYILTFGRLRYLIIAKNNK